MLVKYKQPKQNFIKQLFNFNHTFLRQQVHFIKNFCLHSSIKSHSSLKQKNPPHRRKYQKWCARPETYQYLPNPLKSLGLLKFLNQIFTNAIHFAIQFSHILHFKPKKLKNTRFFAEFW